MCWSVCGFSYVLLYINVILNSIHYIHTNNNSIINNKINKFSESFCNNLGFFFHYIAMRECVCCRCYLLPALCRWYIRLVHLVLHHCHQQHIHTARYIFSLKPRTCSISRCSSRLGSVCLDVRWMTIIDCNNVEWAFDELEFSPSIHTKTPISFAIYEHRNNDDYYLIRIKVFFLHRAHESTRSRMESQLKAW